MLNEPPRALRDLRELLQTLPQELYNNIYDEVFTAVSSNVVVQDRSYKWPHLLHVNRASRETYAKSYFGLTTFFCHGTFENRWVTTLCPQHVKFVKELFFLCNSSEDENLWRMCMIEAICGWLHGLCKGKAKQVHIISRSEAKERFGI